MTYPPEEYDPPAVQWDAVLLGFLAGITFGVFVVSTTLLWILS